jgi:glycosyltransferase involved in cell wall biosynthesis
MTTSASVPPVKGLGQLVGNLEVVAYDRLVGWAMDTDEPVRPVGLEILIDGEIRKSVLANRFRLDLAEAGIGDGHHAFVVALPELSPLAAHEIRVRRETDGAELSGSPRIIPAAERFDVDVERHLTNLLANLEHGEAETRALNFLARETERLLARRGELDAGTPARRALNQFRRRWGGQIRTRAEAPVPKEKPRALFIDDHVPDIRRDAGSAAILSHMRALAALGYEVGFVAARGLGDQVANDALAREAAVQAYGAPFYYCVEDVLKRQSSTFDVIYLHRLSNAEQYMALARTYQPRARVLYSVADLHNVRLARQGAVEGRPELTLFSRQVAFKEFAAASQADAVITHSAVEAAVLRRAAPAKVHVAPWTVLPAPRPALLRDRAGVAFIGQSGHPPNPDAVQWLIREIMPRVWAHDSSVRCQIVGHGWNGNAVPGCDERVDVVGSVSDLGDVLGAVRLTVAPLRFGAGIKGKVLESFAAGVPCVMSPIAAEGLPLAAPLTGLVADGADAIAATILRVHDDEALHRAVAAAGLDMIARENSEARVSESLAGALGQRRS